MSPPVKYVFADRAIDLIQHNVKHYQKDGKCQDLLTALQNLKEQLIESQSYWQILDKNCSKFDFSPNIHGNGFLSFKNVLEQAEGKINDLSYRLMDKKFKCNQNQQSKAPEPPKSHDQDSETSDAKITKTPTYQMRLLKHKLQNPLSFKKAIQKAEDKINILTEKVRALVNAKFGFSQEQQYVTEFQTQTTVMISLNLMGKFITTKIFQACKINDPMPNSVDIPPKMMLDFLDKVPQKIFFGTCLGFHFPKNLKNIFNLFTVAMCCFSQYQKTNKSFKFLKDTSYFIHNPGARAKYFLHIVNTEPAEFFAQFFKFVEKRKNKLQFSEVEVKLQIEVSCNTESQIETLSGETITIRCPEHHNSESAIICFLISNVVHKGISLKTPQVQAVGENKLFSPAKGILFNCHGGGFVSSSTRGQLGVLKQWANELQVPIFSVDYSLAPSAKHPTQLQELLVAYVWMLNNFQFLGTTGERIVFTGTSSGGNMVLALTIKCLELNIRPPDGIFLIYPIVAVKLISSPSRLLTFIDSIFPFQLTMKCLIGYGGNTKNQKLPIKAPTPAASDGPSSKEEEAMKEKYKQEIFKVLDQILEVIQSDNQQNLLDIERQWNTESASANEESIYDQNYMKLEDELLQVEIVDDHYLNIFNAPKHILKAFPPTSIRVSEFDFCLDECVTLAKNLEASNVPVTLDIMQELPHGLLMLDSFSTKSVEGNQLSIQRLKNLLFKQ